MKMSDLIRASLSSTRNELAEVFPHLSDEIMDWAPADGMRTIKGQLVEIIGTEVSIISHLMGQPKRPYGEIEAELEPLNGVEELLKKLLEVRETTLEFLSSLTEERLAESAEVSQGTRSYMELEEVPVGEMLRYLIRHESYHTGQLVSYLWAKGNNPYSWDSQN